MRLLERKSYAYNWTMPPWSIDWFVNRYLVTKTDRWRYMTRAWPTMINWSLRLKRSEILVFWCRGDGFPLWWGMRGRERNSEEILLAGFEMWCMTSVLSPASEFWVDKNVLSIPRESEMSNITSKDRSNLKLIWSFKRRKMKLGSQFFGHLRVFHDWKILNVQDRSRITYNFFFFVVLKYPYYYYIVRYWIWQKNSEVW